MSTNILAGFVAAGDAGARNCRACAKAFERWSAAAAGSTMPVSAVQLVATDPTPPSVLALLGRELVGEPGPAAMAVVLGVLMAISLLAVLVTVISRVRRLPRPARPGGALLVGALVGLVAAAYLSYAELTRSPLQCGFLTDCDLVLTSVYAHVGGVPVAVLGLLGYLGILAAWLAARYGPDRWRGPVGWVLLGTAVVGTVYSGYLTFLEPFVIGAVCPWCLTSAVAMTVVMLLAARAVLCGASRDLRATT